ALSGVFERILHQVPDEDLRVRRSCQDDGVGREIDLQAQRPRVDQRGKMAEHAVANLRQVDRLTRPRQGGVELVEQQQVLYQGGQPPGLLVRLLQERFVLFRRAPPAEGDFHVTGQRLEGSPQLVGGRRVEAPL